MRIAAIDVGRRNFAVRAERITKNGCEPLIFDLVDFEGLVCAELVPDTQIAKIKIKKYFMIKIILSSTKVQNNCKVSKIYSLNFNRHNTLLGNGSKRRTIYLKGFSF